MQVKVMYWVNNDEQNSLTEITMRFGRALPISVYNANKQSFAVPKFPRAHGCANAVTYHRPCTQGARRQAKLHFC
jgi:hypothetical protein